MVIFFKILHFYVVAQDNFGAKNTEKALSVFS
jgi:hypothetical protein